MPITRENIINIILFGSQTRCFNNVWRKIDDCYLCGGKRTAEEKENGLSLYYRLTHHNIISKKTIKI